MKRNTIKHKRKHHHHDGVGANIWIYDPVAEDLVRRDLTARQARIRRRRKNWYRRTGYTVHLKFPGYASDALHGIRRARRTLRASALL